jgi:hypothetical protein
MDILGNELADLLAKESTLEPPESEEISLAYLSSKIRLLAIEAWEEKIREAIQKNRPSPSSYIRTYSLRPKTSISLSGTKRELASSLYQLKIGHGYYRDYLCKIGRSRTCLYSCGKVETPRHLVLSCSELSRARARLRDKLGTSRLTLPLLLETKKGLEGTLDFLKSTGILTRKWYTLRERDS